MPDLKTGSDRETATDQALPGLIRTLAFTFGIAARSYPGLTVGTLVLVPASWVVGSLQALWLKQLVDGAVEKATGAIVLAVSLLALTNVLGWVASAIGGRIRQTYLEKAGVVLEERLIETSAGLNGIEHLERPDYLDRLDPLRKEAWILHWTLEALSETVGAVAQTLVTVVLLASINPALVLLPLFGVPSVLVARRAAAREQLAQDRTGEARRRQRHLVNLGSGAAQGKEIRIFGIGPRLLELSRDSWRAEHAIRTRVVRVAAVQKALATLVMAAGFTGALLLIGRGLVTGQTTVGDLALAVILAATMSGNVGLLVDMIQWLSSCLEVGRRFLWLHDRAAVEQLSDAQRAPVAVPERLRSGISLQGLRFSYPGTDRVIFDRISVDLPAGSVIALVGENGVGKTTLVKLLCGMYTADEGAVLVDGIDLRDFDLDAWRRRCTGAFQDHAQFELTLREAVTIGDLAHLHDDEAATRALAAAGAARLLETTPHGLDTQLGTTWPGGVGLSGGQWQQVALARGLMRQRPLLTVLDEPTSALDAHTEDALFSSYAASARQRSADGGITLLVSHRFSTVRAADHIIVLDQGHVIEQGDHASLLRAGGRYADMYQIQADAYRT